MADSTIINSSPLGQHLDKIAESQQVSYLVFNKKKIQITAKISIGRESDNDIVIDSKLASRHHCIIQKIKDDYFLKDENSTNGTFINIATDSFNRDSDSFDLHQYRFNRKSGRLFPTDPPLLLLT